MPEGLPGGPSQVCACPGCDELVVQVDPGSPRLYHSHECRKKARRLRHHSEAADAAEPGPAAAVLGHLPGAADDPGGAGAEEPDAAGDPDASEFWKPDDVGTGKFWDAGRRPALRGARSPGSHRTPASTRRLRRSRTAAVAVALAAGVAGLGLITSQPGKHHPLPASGARLPAPGPVASPPPSTSSPARTRSGRTPHAPGRVRSGPTAHPPSTAPSPPSTNSSSPTPAPSKRARPSPKPSTSRKPTPRPSKGLVSFEDGTDGWGPFWGKITATRTTKVAYSGTHSLLITTSGDTYTAVGVHDGAVAHLRPGDKVSFHIWSSGRNGSVQPFVQDDSYNAHKAGSTPLPARGWFTLNWTVPDVSSVHAIGLQLTNAGSAKLTIAIDALSWPGS